VEQYTWKELILKAQNHDENAREDIFNLSYSFIQKTASRFCKRPLSWSNDEELSISLQAFNEAINTYDGSKNSTFYHYARVIIQRRLVDYFRKEGRHQHLPLENEPEEDQSCSIDLEAKASLEKYLKEVEIEERRSEIEILAGELSRYGLNLEVLEKKAPRHYHTREKLLEAAQALAGKPTLLNHLQEKGYIPLKELSEATGLSKKTLKRGRAYIIALSLVISTPELVYLRSYLNINSGKRGDGNET